MKNLVTIYEQYIERILSDWERNMLEREYVNHPSRTLEIPRVTVKNVIIALGYFMEHEKSTYLSPSDKCKQMIYELAIHITEKNSLRGVQIHYIQDRILMLKYAMVNVFATTTELDDHDLLYVHVFFDYVINQFTEISVENYQKAFQTLATPILNLESLDTLYSEILHKTSLLLQQDYCSLVIVDTRVKNVMISDYTGKLYEQTTHPVDFDIIKRVKKEKITFIKLSEGKSKLQDRAQISSPILVEDNVYGILNLHFRHAHDFASNEQEMLEILARQASTSIRTLTLYREVSNAYQISRIVNDELRSTKTQLEQSNQKLMELDRLKSRFIANMSHELRTPLNTIIGFSGLLIQNLEGTVDREVVGDLNNIHDSGQYLLRLINDILDLSKLEAGKMQLDMEEVDLYEILLGTHITLQSLVYEKAIQVDFKVTPSLATIWGDETRIRQVLYNIVGNAAKFTKHGQIIISAYTDEQNQNVVVCVSDTGIGIKNEDNPKVFERFSQIHHKENAFSEKGTGLGMTISKELIHRMNGEIWFESKYKKGTNFYFSLPIYIKKEH